MFVQFSESRCDDADSYVRTKVDCIQGSCNLPSVMYARKNLAAANGATYGLVSPAIVRVDTYASATNVETQIDTLVKGVKYATNRDNYVFTDFPDKYQGAIYLRGDNDKTNALIKSRGA